MNKLIRFYPAIMVFLLIILTETTYAQKDYEAVNGVNDYIYYIKGELILDYSSSVYYSEFDTRTSCKYHVVAPLFLSYNRNDLKYFRAEPEKMYEYADAFLGTTNYFSDNRGENEIFAGMMKADEWIQSTQGDITSEVNAKGNIDQSVNIQFKMYNAEDVLKSGGRNFVYRIYINAVSCPTCEQKNVSGSTRTGEYSFTEGVSLDVNFVWGVTFGTDLAKHILENNMESIGGIEKDKFEAKFEREYFKTLPETDAVKLNDFLINPKGTYEIPISGYFNSPDGTTEKTTFKGNLRLFGIEVHQYWVEKPGE
jgi:hypothetical protein